MFIIQRNANHSNSADNDDFVRVQERQAFSGQSAGVYARFDDIRIVDGSTARDGLVLVTIAGRKPSGPAGFYVSRDELNAVAAEREARRRAQADRDAQLVAAINSHAEAKMREVEAANRRTAALEEAAAVARLQMKLDALTPSWGAPRRRPRRNALSAVLAEVGGSKR
jgi:hypothetical protein